ncbi:NYN domain-containing protein [Rhodoferax aquaticus]|uniref:NYN domain-containing protein n=1 Tax=Rhodoferax aquaticus TaxID=2527691 RepID=A0A515EUC5_9BURK|nr:NYN domain-containing protein [Rhodoferax aquaticus]QDL56287.1 NYN domain-containing protein [Rhodoferax aquaticus]
MVIFLIDADNLSSPAWIEEACAGLESTEGTLTVRRAYGSAENLKGLAQTMLGRAIRPFVNLSLSKNTTDVALAVDAMELACQLPKPAVIAIGSGDADFVPLVVRLRERGIRMVCVSERTKMAAEAVHAYDAVIFVGKDTIKQAAEMEAPSPTKKKPARKAVVKQVAVAKASAAIPKTVKTKGQPKSATAGGKGEVTLVQVLEAAPALKTGQVQPLGDIVQQLHAAKLIGKNATSTRLFKKFPDKFELIPDKQPNQVRYVSA